MWESVRFPVQAAAAFPKGQLCNPPKDEPTDEQSKKTRLMHRAGHNHGPRKDILPFVISNKWSCTWTQNHTIRIKYLILMILEICIFLQSNCCSRCLHPVLECQCEPQLLCFQLSLRLSASCEAASSSAWTLTSNAQDLDEVYTDLGSILAPSWLLVFRWIGWWKISLSTNPCPIDHHCL